MDSEIEPRPVAVCPVIRCCVLLNTATPVLCGRAAPWQGSQLFEGAPVYRCDEHRQPGDRPLQAPVVYREVTLHVTVRLASAPYPAAIAFADAMTALEAAVIQAGGLVSIRDVTAEWVRHWPGGLPDLKAAVGGRG